MEKIEVPFPLIVIDDLYDDNEQKRIWGELDFLESKLMPPEEVGSAYDGDNKSLKNSNGLWIDDLYSDRNTSNILTANRKPLAIIDQECRNLPNDWWFRNTLLKDDFTLLSYYEDGGYYSKHSDIAHMTVLTWFYRTPKSFEGGNLTFNDYDLTIDCVHNRMVAFPSMIFHSVDKIIMDDKDMGKGLGRWCITQFGHDQRVSVV